MIFMVSIALPNQKRAQPLQYHSGELDCVPKTGMRHDFYGSGSAAEIKKLDKAKRMCYNTDNFRREVRG